MSRSFWLVVIVSALAGCDQNVGPPGAVPQTRPQQMQPQASTDSGTTAKADSGSAPTAREGSDAAAGVVWTPPPRWVSQGARPMRVATYRVPAAQGDPEDGECAVFYFGSGQGGTVEANLKRWIAQFEQPGGASSEEAAKIERQVISGLNVTTIDLSGTYLASAGPMSPVKQRKPNYRLLGAIVDAPKGNLFFKFSGPAPAVAASAEQFRAMLQSLRRQ